MTRQVVTFEDFTRGEFGDLGPRLPANLRVEDGSGGWFTGKNVMKYRSGAVGPRPGLRQWERVGSGWPNGRLRTLYSSINALEYTFAIIGTKARAIGRQFVPLELTVTRQFNDDDIPVSTTFPTNGQHRVDGNWVIVPGHGVYKADLDDNNVQFIEALTGKVFRFDKVRQLASHISEVYYSEAGPGGWDEFNDFFTPTTYNGATAFLPLRNGVAIPLSGGVIDLVSGTIGASSSVLRRITSRTGPEHPYAAASIGSEFLVMMGFRLPYPALYNGSTWEELPHLAYCGPGGAQYSGTGDRPHHTVVDLEWNNSWMILSGLNTVDGAENRMLLSWDECRTFHTWEQEVLPYARRFENGIVMLAQGGVAGTSPPEFYAFYPQLDRPGFVSDNWAQPGDTSDTPIDAWMHLPAWSGPGGVEVMVKGLDIAITRWNTGAAETNHFDVTVDARRRYGYGNPITSMTQTFDEAGAEASMDGDDVTVHLGFGDQGYGNEFQIKIDSLRGCAIRSVVAVLEQRAERV